MTVKELRGLLSTMDESAKVLIKTKGKVVNGFPAKALYCEVVVDKHVAAKTEFVRLTAGSWEFFDL